MTTELGTHQPQPLQVNQRLRTLGQKRYRVVRLGQQDLEHRSARGDELVGETLPRHPDSARGERGVVAVLRRAAGVGVRQTDDVGRFGGDVQIDGDAKVFELRRGVADLLGVESAMTEPSAGRSGRALLPPQD